MLRWNPQVLLIVGKHSTTELQPTPKYPCKCLSVVPYRGKTWAFIVGPIENWVVWG